ncbi:MAG: CCA tRNA nucleotidyltransferase [Sphingomonas sp.]
MSPTLPDAAWRHRAGLVDLCTALGASDGAARFVGGAVRDTLLGLPVADIDIATKFTPQDVVSRLTAAGIRAVPTGIAHGTITAVLPDGPVEVTTLRRDVTTDGRHAVIAYTDDWRDDAARRDFTMNALYADPATGALFDYFGGLVDIVAGHIRFIGDPLLRIAEDHLRILRFFRFVSRFADVPEPVGLAACTARANDLMALSRERIADELLKLLVTRRAPGTLGLMVAHGILAPVLPEIDHEGTARLAALADRERALGVLPDPVRRLAALLPRDPATTDAIGARLKLSKAQRKQLSSAVANVTNAAPLPLAYRVGKAAALDWLLLSTLEQPALTQAWAAIEAWDMPSLPISGGMLVERGLSRGPDVARTLRTIEDQWIAEGFPGSERVDAITETAVVQALRAASSA